MDDNLYVNDGETYANQDYQPTEPEDQVTERSEEYEKFAASYPIMPDLIAWFENEIATATSNENIQFEAMTINGVKLELKVSIEAQVYAGFLLKRKLEAKFSEFKHLKDNS